MERWKGKIDQGRKRLPRGVVYRSAGSAWRVLFVLGLMLAAVFPIAILSTDNLPIWLAVLMVVQLVVIVCAIVLGLTLKAEINNHGLATFYASRPVCRFLYGSVHKIEFYVPESRGIKGSPQVNFFGPSKHIHITLSQFWYSNAKPLVLEALLRVVEANPKLVVEPEILRWLGLSAAEFAKLLDAEPV